ncbi:MAG: hypothetical protein RL174_168 [Actinomycetota bacterium]
MKNLNLGRNALGVYAALAITFLMIPIVYTIAFSFNDSGRSNASWVGFTFDKWLNVCADQGVCDAVSNSILVGVISTVLATAIGTAAAIALVRYRFRFRSAVNLLIFLPLATPEIIMGSGLAAQFFNFGVDRGLLTVIAAHVLFCLSFVVVTVKARVQILDPALEEAGRDLYATPAKVFFKITLPILMPGILAAALLSFALSFDDFIVTYFNSGPVQTFPLFIYSQTKGVPAEANVVSSAVFILAIAIVVTVQLRTSIRNAKLKKLAK